MDILVDLIQKSDDGYYTNIHRVIYSVSDVKIQLIPGVYRLEYVYKFMVDNQYEERKDWCVVNNSLGFGQDVATYISSCIRTSRRDDKIREVLT